MSQMLAAVEKILIPYTKGMTPNGSNPKALVHQWAHSIASQGGLIGGFDRSVVIKALRDGGVYRERQEFKEALYGEIIFPPPSDPGFSFIDLFAGIGGFRLALQKSNGVCVFSSEWDPSAQQTYLANYGELPFGDITPFTSDSIPDSDLDRLIPSHDILAGGFPCQPFSHAGVSARNSVGKEHGFKCETQGTLFFDIMRIASVKKPKVLFLENVRNIQSHDGGRTFSVIRKSIEDLGYDFKYEIIDSSSMVPQRRLRCYMVCFRQDLKVDFAFPEFKGKSLALRTILESNPSEKFVISDKLWDGHINRTRRNLERGTGFTAFTADLDKPSNTLVARYGKDGKECLIPRSEGNPRLLTPRECARLQGFPDEFVIPAAKTPAYRQFGNSVAVPVVTKLSEAIVRAML